MCVCVCVCLYVRQQIPIFKVYFNANFQNSIYATY